VVAEREAHPVGTHEEGDRQGGNPLPATDLHDENGRLYGRKVGSRAIVAGAGGGSFSMTLFASFVPGGAAATRWPGIRIRWFEWDDPQPPRSGGVHRAVGAAGSVGHTGPGTRHRRYVISFLGPTRQERERHNGATASAAPPPCPGTPGAECAPDHRTDLGRVQLTQPKAPPARKIEAGTSAARFSGASR